MDRPNAMLQPPHIRDLIARQPAGHAMLRDFYSDEEVYSFDCQKVWRTGWLFAGHSCEISKPGDYFTIEVDADSIIITRDAAGHVRALNNVCRHRGSLICEDAVGHVKKLVCP